MNESSSAMNLAPLRSAIGRVACPPLPYMPTYRQYAVTGVGRRVKWLISQVPALARRLIINHQATNPGLGQGFKGLTTRQLDNSTI
ncbi:MAG: hypothetical protein KAU38_04495 [Desulfobacterales bacterium]|nr:hypothetical protein [Desulfobacterales bacterium]